MKGWAVGYDIHYTMNGGASWIRLRDTGGPERITFANETHGWVVWYRKDRSYITSVGGVPPIDENMLNLGASVCIFLGISIPVLFTVTLMLYLQRKAPKEGFSRFSDRLCPACGGQILPKAKFCINCGNLFLANWLKDPSLLEYYKKSRSVRFNNEQVKVFEGEILAWWDADQPDKLDSIHT